MGSSAKTGNFFYWRITGAFLCVKNIKVPFGIGHPPHLHIKPSPGGGGGGCMGVGAVWGVPHTHVHMHAHARTHTHAHARVVNMTISCKWLPPLGKSLGIPYDVIRACACVCTCVRGTPSPPPTHIHPPPHPPGGGTPRINQNSIALELIEIFQFRLKI